MNKWINCINKIYEKSNTIYREYRMVQVPNFSPIPDYGDVMTLKEFESACKDGSFIDTDGFGYYVNDDQETDIEIFPSDYHYGTIRKDFNKIIWFNK